MSGINQINLSTPFLIGVPNSIVSREWIRLLNAIVTAVGLPNSIVVDEFQTEVFTSRFPVNQTASIEELRTAQIMVAAQRGAIAALSQRLADLENLIPIQGKRLPALLSPEESLATLPSRSGSSTMTSMVMDDVATNVTMYPTFANGIAGNRPLNTSSTKWTYNPSTGRVTSTQLVATAGFGCNGTTPQTAFASGGAAPSGGTGATAGAYDTAAHRDAMITLINNIRSALVANGIMS